LHKQENGKHIKQRSLVNVRYEDESFPSKILLNFSLLLTALQPLLNDSLSDGLFDFKKMPGSPGSVAAHHIYNKTTQVICKMSYDGY